MITGVPTSAMSATTYTITGTNTTGSFSQTFTLTILPTCAEGGACQIGDIGPGGGTVFYVATTPFTCGPTLAATCTYLEAAPTTGASAWTDAVYDWSGNSIALIGTTAREIGKGYANTVAMFNLDSTAGKAGTIARTYRGPNNLSDWFLPSMDELNELYLQKTTVGGFAASRYWSSTDYDKHLAWAQSFWDGDQHYQSNNTYYVRPIRAFSQLASPAITLTATSGIAKVASAFTGTYTINSTGGQVSSYSIAPSLPAGLTFDTTTGLISGTPIAGSTSTSYTITATNVMGSATATYSLSVLSLCAQGKACAVGDTGPGGGTVFYVSPTPFACGPLKGDSCLYLEVAPKNWYQSIDSTKPAQDPTMMFSSAANANSAVVSFNGFDASGTDVGGGYAMTMAIVNQNGAFNPANNQYAAGAAHAYQGGGYSDWYLMNQPESQLIANYPSPSNDADSRPILDLALMSANDHGSLPDGYWNSWSGNPDAPGAATDTTFCDGPCYNNGYAGGYKDKDQQFFVRPIRAFAQLPISGTFACPGGGDYTLVAGILTTNNACTGDLTLDTNVLGIGGYGLNGSQLTSLTIPATVTSIVASPFADSGGTLTAITVDPANTKYASIDGVLFNKDATEELYLMPQL